ncbi:uncharacterized protein DNG_00983 [Cephalotrichum gorgonifer]|uniref:Uncharacterized protein n=1 Tax=Cephalotrichum gorgonifer TaxID=2041049 RepID=A0AAE8MQC2_9PEZI|nr:uncharacterized protein DNG_00983 [Cephalotrichum gorgonifer]
MEEQDLVFAAMKEELGNQRVDTLPLDNSSRRPSYQPRRTRVIRTAAMMKMASGWKNAIASGVFNDSDSRPVQGLEDMGGPRLYDTLNPRRSSARPPAWTTRPEDQEPEACQPTRGPAPAVRLSPPSTMDSGPKAATGTPHPPVPILTHHANAPPTPGPSPTAPTTGGSVGASSGAPGKPPADSQAAVPQPKPSRGLGSSRWASSEGNPKPTMGSQVSSPNVRELKVTNGEEVLRQEAAQRDQNQPEKQTSSPAMDQPVSIDGQDACQSASHRDMVEQATQGLANLKITESEPSHRAGEDPFIGANAWLLDPLGTKACALYLVEGDHDDAVFRVDLGSDTRGSHDLLDLLSYTCCGTLLDLAFRSVANDLIGYSFELETEKTLKKFVEVMESLRDLTLQILSEELNDLKGSSTSAMIRKQTEKGDWIAHSVGLTTVTYGFPTPKRREISLRPELKRASTTQRLPSPSAKAETPTSKGQRLTYSAEGLETLRNASIIPRGMNTDFIQSMKQASHKKTDSQECVVGMDASVSSQARVERSGEGGDDSSTVLGEIHRSVSKNKAWLFKSGTGL